MSVSDLSQILTFPFTERSTETEGPFQIVLPPSNQLQLSTELRSSIEKVVSTYNKFKEMKSYNERDFSSAFDECQKLNLSYQQLVQMGANDEAKQVKPVVDQLERLIREMGAVAPHFTKQDVKGIISFLTPSIEKEYEDKETGTLYLMPDHSQLLPFADKYFTTDTYVSYSLAQHRKLPNPLTKQKEVCDILSLTKHDSQINHESSQKQPPSINPFSSFFNSASKVESIIEKQKTMFSKASGELKKLSKEWGYASFCPATTNELVDQFGYREEAAKTFHAVIFFYKKKEQKDVH